MKTALLIAVLTLLTAWAPPPVSAQQTQQQTVAPAAIPAAVPSPADVQGLMAQIDRTAQDTAQTIGQLRIRKWKADSDYKNLSQHNAESLQRNITAALPVLTSALAAGPQDLSAGFKLYRNMNALYDVLKSLTESAGAFGPKDDFNSLGQNAIELEQERMKLADYLEAMAQQQQAELLRLRTHAAAQAQAPKKIIVDNEPEKTTSKKKKKKPR